MLARSVAILFPRKFSVIVQTSGFGCSWLCVWVECRMCGLRCRASVSSDEGRSKDRIGSRIARTNCGTYAASHGAMFTPDAGNTSTCSGRHRNDINHMCRVPNNRQPSVIRETTPNGPASDGPAMSGPAETNILRDRNDSFLIVPPCSPYCRCSRTYRETLYEMLTTPQMARSLSFVQTALCDPVIVCTAHLRM